MFFKAGHGLRHQLRCGVEIPLCAGNIGVPKKMLHILQQGASIEQVGGKVTVLHEGSVLAEGSLDHVQNDERVIEVYLGR